MRSRGWRSGAGWWSRSGARPLIFCWVFEGRRSRSAWLDVGGMAVSVRNRSTSASRCLRHSSRCRAGGCLTFLPPGTRRTSNSAGVDAVAEQLEVPGGQLARDGGQALAAGHVSGVDEGPQLTGDLGGPDRLRVGLRSVLDVPEQVGCAQLVADAAEVVVVDVPVVHHDGAVQVAVDEALERGQGPLAQEVIGEQAGAGDLQVLLVRPGAGPARSGVSSPQMTRASRISARIVLFAAATALAARASRACTHPSDGRVPAIDSMMSAQRSTGT